MPPKEIAPAMEISWRLARPGETWEPPIQITGNRAVHTTSVKSLPGKLFLVYDIGDWCSMGGRVWEKIKRAIGCRRIEFESTGFRREIAKP